MSDKEIEQLILDKGLTKPRVTPKDIQDSILEVVYFNGLHAVGSAAATLNPTTIQTLSLNTFCIIVLKNGYSVEGKSVCASPENFDEEVGRRIAYENAIQEIWPLLGFSLKEKLYRGELTG